MDATDELEAVPGDVEEGINFVDEATEGPVLEELEGVGCAPCGGDGLSGFDGSWESMNRGHSEFFQRREERK